MTLNVDMCNIAPYTQHKEMHFVEPTLQSLAQLYGGTSRQQLRYVKHSLAQHLLNKFTNLSA